MANPNRTKIENEQVFEDGGYVATFVDYGRAFAVHFVMGEVRVTFIGRQGDARGWQHKGSAEAVRKAAAARIEALGPEFMAKHRALYELDGVAA
jgi:hypothetical protein